MPSFTGVGMPGMANGKLPRMMPNRMPVKIGNSPGSSRRFRELPSRCATFSICFSSPTTVSLSPNCSTMSGCATSSMPARVIRVILISKRERSFSEERFFPITGRLVTKTCLETNLPMYVAKSKVLGFPSNLTSSGMSPFWATNSTISPLSHFVSELAMDSFPLCNILEITASLWRWWLISFIFFPKNSGFVISMLIFSGLASWGFCFCSYSCCSFLRSVLEIFRIKIMVRIRPSTPKG